MQLVVGYIVPATVIKANPGEDTYLMMIADTGFMGLLPRSQAGKQYYVGDTTIAAIRERQGNHITLSQTVAFFFSRLVEMLLAPLVSEGKIQVKRAAHVYGSGFAKVVVNSANGCDPIAESVPLLAGVGLYTKTRINLIRYSPDPDQYLINAFSPAPADAVWEVIHTPDKDGEVIVRVDPAYVRMFMGPKGHNVATVSKLLGKRVIVV
ncbi:MAG TPA: hypothetical protein PLN56_10110 [Methanoregulaceae archaeon]|nr:hypothetical protein [Methanothrix sp.]HOL44410.1 hypothetical protein [Methanothrix sp.]HON93895.1 hypothetical protein [Sedimentisphaerales bacterium]HPD11329.1 hypothetical protein [Methanoregulaceae archaeon]